MAGCHRTSLDRSEVTPSEEYELVEPLLDMGGAVSPTQKDMSTMVYDQSTQIPSTYSNYTFHSQEDAITKCIDKDYGCFERVHTLGLRFFATFDGVLEKTESSPLRQELYELKEQGYYIGLSLPHSDGTYHMFECGAQKYPTDYHTEDIYARCQEHIVFYKYNEYRQDYAEGQRTVGNSCSGDTSEGPFIRDPWFSYYKEARESGDGTDRFVMRYDMLVHSLERTRSYRIGPFVAQYRFHYRQDACSEDALAIAVDSPPAIKIERMELD